MVSTFNVVDDFNREVLAIEVDLNLPTPRVIRVLERIIAWRCMPGKLRMDNGPEFISTALCDWAENNKVELEFIRPGKIKNQIKKLTEAKNKGDLVQQRRQIKRIKNNIINLSKNDIRELGLDRLLI